MNVAKSEIGFPQFILAAPLKRKHAQRPIESRSGFPQFILAAPLKLVNRYGQGRDRQFSAVHSCGSIEAPNFIGIVLG